LVLAEENLYGPTYRLFQQVFAKYGLKVQYLDFNNQENIHKILTIKPQLIWLESPTNPSLKILDIQKISIQAKKANSVLVVDNTFASPINQKPLELGADLSLASATKYINGHSDALLGVVATNSKKWQEKLIFAQKAVGLNPSPFDTWLVHRGVKTLPLRMERHNQNALELAKWFQSIPPSPNTSGGEDDALNLDYNKNQNNNSLKGIIKSVSYPFLPSHPQFEIAKTQMSGGSGIVTVDFNLSFEKVYKLLSNLKIWTLAESLGGVESLVDHPASMTHASIPKKEREKVGISDGLVRFSCGIEDVEDLIEDLKSTIIQLINNN